MASNKDTKDSQIPPQNPDPIVTSLRDTTAVMQPPQNPVSPSASPRDYPSTRNAPPVPQVAVAGTVTPPAVLQTSITPPPPPIPVSPKAYRRPGPNDDEIQSKTFYVHKRCETLNEMTPEMARAHVEIPDHYPAAYCVHCRDHFPIEEFVFIPYAEGLKMRGPRKAVVSPWGEEEPDR